MSDLNRRFSKGQLNKKFVGGVNGLPGLPQNGYMGNAYSNGNNDNNNSQFQYNATTSSLSVNYVQNNRYNNQNHFNPNMMTSAESIHSNATNATNATSATTRRRFSVKLSQPPVDLYNSMNAPSLPFNAQSQIQNSSYVNISESGVESSLPPIKQNGIAGDFSFDQSIDSNTDNKNDINNSNIYRSPKKTAQDILNEFSVPDFNADMYVHRVLSDANAASIDDFSNKLDNLKVSNDNSVKYTLSESTAQVLAVSDAIKQTQEVLLSLKPKINDLTDLLSQQLEEAHEYQNKSSDPLTSNSSNKVNRQSVMILQNKWSNAMKKLYSNIDRAHDLLPPLPSRHIIIESRRWGELNSITCNPIRPVHIVVLNDSILIASRVRDPTKYLPETSNDNTSSKKNKASRNIATHIWMIDSINVQKCSEIKELNDILSNNNLSFSKNKGHSDADSDSAAESTLCIKTHDTNQTFLFQTDLSTEFIRVYNAIQQAKAESASLKRKSMMDSFSKVPGRPDSRHISIGGMGGVPSSSDSNAALEKQIEPEFNASISTIDDLLTSASLELGLQRYDECVGYISRLEDEIRQLAEMALALGIPKTLLNSKSLTSSKKDGHQFSIFIQNVHLTYNIKVSYLKKITEQLVSQLLEEISSSTASMETLKECIDIFRILRREKEAAEIFLESRGRELSDCVDMVRVGGSSNSNSLELSNSSNPKSKGFSDKNLSRSNSSNGLNATLVNSRPSSINVTPEADDYSEDSSTAVKLDSIGGVTGELITAYVRELSLVYMGFVSRVWLEWNELFIDGKSASTDKKNQSKVSNVRMIEWINEHIAELSNSVQIALADYERTGEVFKSSSQTMKNVFEGLKAKELNVDYLLEI